MMVLNRLQGAHSVINLLWSEQDADGTPCRILDKIQMTYKIKLAYTGDELTEFLNEMDSSFPGHEIVTVIELIRQAHSFLAIVRY